MRLNFTLRSCVLSCIWRRIGESKHRTKYVMHFAIVLSHTIKFWNLTPFLCQILKPQYSLVRTWLLVRGLGSVALLRRLAPDHDTSTHTDITYFRTLTPFLRHWLLRGQALFEKFRMEFDLRKLGPTNTQLKTAEPLKYLRRFFLWVWGCCISLEFQREKCVGFCVVHSRKIAQHSRE